MANLDFFSANERELVQMQISDIVKFFIYKENGAKTVWKKTLKYSSYLFETSCICLVLAGPQKTAKMGRSAKKGQSWFMIPD